MHSTEKNVDLLGHEDAWNFLWHTWKIGRLAHAWLIKGPRGIGKATFAIRFSFSVLENSISTQARYQSRYNHPNLMLVQKQDHGTGKGSVWITTSEIHKIKHFLNLTATMVGPKIVVIDEAESMSTSAANALLKILEDPPQQSLLLLVVSCSGRLSPTIHSRCHVLNLHPLSTLQIITLLTQYRPLLGKTDIHAIAILSEGSIGKALDLSDNGGITLYYTMLDLLKQAPNFDTVTLYSFSSTVAMSGSALFNTIGSLFRRWLVLIGTRDVPDLNHIELVPGEEFLVLSSNTYSEKVWVIWEKVNYLFNQADPLALDYQQVILHVFSIIGMLV